MWNVRNLSWNSSDSGLPDGMFKHETGPYFKTPSIQSGGASSTHSVTDPTTTNPPSETKRSSLGYPQQPTDKGTDSTELQAQQPASSSANRRWRSSETTIDKSSYSHQSVSTSSSPPKSHQQQSSTSRQPKRPAKVKHTADNATQVQHSSSRTRQDSDPESSRQHQSNLKHAQGFRSRLSSISGALQHPPRGLAKLLNLNGGSSHQDSCSNEPIASHIQITTTSIDSPKRDRRLSGGRTGSERELSDSGSQQHPPRFTSSSSGRRLSQLFLPQMPPNILLQQQQQQLDPYVSPNELLPPHLLGLFGQPPLVGGSLGDFPSACPSGVRRGSWVDAGLLGRLVNIRPSLDSAIHVSGARLRHSFDARKYSTLWLLHLS